MLTIWVEPRVETRPNNIFFDILLGRVFFIIEKNMKFLIQKVTKAEVTVDGNVVGEIGEGLLVLIGIKDGDTIKSADYLIDKTVNMRLFENQGKYFDLPVKKVDGSILLVSQFTLYADCRKGRRPDFMKAAPADKAKKLYKYIVDKFKERGINIATGQYQAKMEVQSVNDGPVTIMLDTDK